ncbi:MAG: S8 family peptidase [Patescibacteria group bacterium]
MSEHSVLPPEALPEQLRKKTNLHIPIILITFFILLGVFFYFSYFTNNTSPLSPSPTIGPSEMPDQNAVVNIVPSSTKENTAIAGQLVIRVKESVTEAQLTDLLTRYNAKIEKKIPALSTYVISVPEEQETMLEDALLASELLAYVEQNYRQQIQMIPNDTYFRNQWGLLNTAQTIKGKSGLAHADVQITAAWDVSQGEGIKIAVLDTGIDLTHPDIASQVIAQKNFITNTVDDKYGHGTHVAGVIAAKTNNERGIAGACPRCQLLIAKTVGDDGMSDTAVVAEGIIWAVDNGAHIINISLGGNDFTQVQSDAVAYAWEKGSLVVAAVGNQGNTTKFYPGALTNVMSVAATNNLDQKAIFSNHGSWVQISAPGENSYSTFPTHAFGMQNVLSLQTNYDYLSGTSMAAPLVSGIAALVWDSAYGGSNTHVVQRLYATADHIEGTGTFWQAGRINAAKAVGYSDPSPSTTEASATPTSFMYCLGGCLTLTTHPPSLTPTAPIEDASLSPVVSLQTVSPSDVMTVIPSDHPNKTMQSDGQESQKGLVYKLLSLILSFLQKLFSLLGY